MAAVSISGANIAGWFGLSLICCFFCLAFREGYSVTLFVFCSCFYVHHRNYAASIGHCHHCHITHTRIYLYLYYYWEVISFLAVVVLFRFRFRASRVFCLLTFVSVVICFCFCVFVFVKEEEGDPFLLCLSFVFRLSSFL